MTPTLPDNWIPPEYIPSPEKDRQDFKPLEPTPIKIITTAKFYFKAPKTIS